MHWCAGHWAHLALLAAVGGALALGAAQQLVQRLATVLVVAEPNRVGAIGGARYSSSILSVWHDGLAPADGCQGSRESDWRSRPPVSMSGSRARLLSPRSASAASPKTGRAPARSRLRKGEEGAHGISDCRQLACAAPPPAARRLPDLGQVPLCAPCPSSRLAARRSWPPSPGYSRRAHS